MEIDWEPLVEAAKRAQQHAYCPYSGFAVGAALLVGDGTVVTGCNMENRSYGLTICAERTAVAAANAAGHRDLQALVVVAPASPAARPCGQCLDTLAEFNPHIPILLVAEDGSREELLLSDLLPQPFSFPVDRRRRREV